MGNEKILLAKMYYDEYLSMPREPAGVNEKLEKYKKKILDDADFGDVEIEVNGRCLTVNHALILKHALIGLCDAFPKNDAPNAAQRYEDAEASLKGYYSSAKSKAERKYRRKNREALLYDKLSEIESAYDRYAACCNEGADSDAKQMLGDIYSYLVFYYRPDEKGKAAVGAIIQRAQERGIAIPSLQYSACTPIELAKRLDEEHIREKKKAAIRYLMDPQINTVTASEISELESAAGIELHEHYQLLTRLDPTVEVEYAVATFKSELEDMKDITDEAREALLSADAEVRTDLIFTPWRTVMWNSTPATYYWKQKWRGADDIWRWYEGNYTLGGGTATRMESLGSLSKYTKTENWKDRPHSSLKENDKYIMPEKQLPDFPSEISASEYVARREIIGELKARREYVDNAELIVSCTVEPRYDFSLGYLAFFPLYSIWIKSGGYVAYGFADATVTGRVTVLEVSKIHDDDIELLVSARFKTDDFKTRAEKLSAGAGGKALASGEVKRSTLLSRISTWSTVIISLATILLRGGKAGLISFLPALIALILPKRSSNRIVRIIMTVLTVAALLASLVIFSTSVLFGQGEALPEAYRAVHSFF